MKLKNTLTLFLSFVALSLAFVSCEGEDDGKGALPNPDQGGDTPHVEEVIQADYDTFVKEVYDIKNDEFILKKPMLLDFGAEWCHGCQQMLPVVHQMAREFKDEVVVYYIDVDKGQNSLIQKALGAVSLPYYLFVTADGKRSKKTSTMTVEEMRDLFEKTKNGESW